MSSQAFKIIYEKFQWERNMSVEKERIKCSFNRAFTTLISGGKCKEIFWLNIDMGEENSFSKSENSSRREWLRWNERFIFVDLNRAQSAIPLQEYEHLG